MDIEAYEFRERVERVERASASEDVLLTVAVPPDESLGEVRQRIAEDRAEAEYIDTDDTDAPHLRALEAVSQRLQQREAMPESGLVVYAGVADGDLVEYAFDDLPTPVEEFVYERANEFDTGPRRGLGVR